MVGDRMPDKENYHDFIEDYIKLCKEYGLYVDVSIWGDRDLFVAKIEDNNVLEEYAKQLKENVDICS